MIHVKSHPLCTHTRIHICYTHIHIYIHTHAHVHMCMSAGLETLVLGLLNCHLIYWGPYRTSGMLPK